MPMFARSFTGRAPVLNLFTSRCPTDVAKFVVSVVINSFDSVIERRLTYLSNELLERIKLELDAPPAIIRICLIGRVSASGLCPEIDVVLASKWAAAMSVGESGI